MNEIAGITIEIKKIPLEDSTDEAAIILIKDSEGKEITIYTAFGKITDIKHG